MSSKQKIALGALPLLVVTMLGVYRLATWLLGPHLAWYAGFWVYWPLWCVMFPWWMLGWRRLRGLFRHGRMPAVAWAVVILPPAVAFVGRFLMGASPVAARAPVAWIAMSFVNGTLEEVLWRGVYVELFPGMKLWGLFWPTLWFALWHFAPGSVSMGPGAWVLVAGAALFGAAMGWVALRTRSIRWTVISHVLAGLVQV
ncbi:MAG: CPBP family intramembrane glutamic endopeptidase [Acidobacteriota bacterium]